MTSQVHTRASLLNQQEVSKRKQQIEDLSASFEVLRSTRGEEDDTYRAGLSVLATLNNNLAVLYEGMGKYGAAESCHRKALEIIGRVLGEEHPDFAISLNNLANVYLWMGRYSESEQLIRRAMKIRRETLGENHPEYANSLNSLAELYRDMNNYPAAEPLYLEALEIRRAVLGEEHPDFARTLNNLAQNYDGMGNYAAAEPLYRQVAKIRRKTLGVNDPEYVQSLLLNARNYLRAGNYDQAELSFQHVLEVQRQVVGKDHPDYANTLSTLANLYWRIGDYKSAEPLFLKTVEIRRKTLGGHHPDYAAALNDLGMIYSATGRYDQALAVMEQTAAVDHRVIGHVFSLGSERHRMNYLETIMLHVNMLLSMIFQHHSGSPAAMAAGLNLVVRRKAIGAEALAAQRDAVLGGRYPELTANLAELSALRSQIAMKTLEGRGAESAIDHRKILADLKAKKEQLEGDLSRKIPEMNLELRLKAADRQAVALALPPDAVLIEFVRFDNFDFTAVPARSETLLKPARYLAFVLPAAQPDNLQMIDLGEADPIDQMVGTFRTAIMFGEDSNGRGLGAVPAPSAQGSIETIGGRLRTAIFDPLSAALEKHKRLMIAPDGDLCRIPFEVLPTDDGQFLIDGFHISYLATGRDLLRMDLEPRRQPNQPIVLADPDFDLGVDQTSADSEREKADANAEPGTQRFSHLPGTRTEGELIAAKLEVEAWLGDRALEARLKASCSPRILHLATHGFFLEDQQNASANGLRGLGAIGSEEHSAERLSAKHLENPLLRSGLALAGANVWLQMGHLPSEAEDGILTAEDVTGIDLLDTELVVLSACETGLGEVHVGEGVFGLRRAFVLAGAKTLVMSLWKVPDEQTCELMGDFYTRILAGQPRASALREAQLALRGKYPDPLCWGAFICQGDQRPLSTYGDSGPQS